MFLKLYEAKTVIIRRCSPSTLTTQFLNEDYYCHCFIIMEFTIEFIMTLDK